MTNLSKTVILTLVAFLCAKGLSAQSWTSVDVGTPSTAGSSVQSDFDFTLTSFGLGVGRPVDDVRFTSQHVNSNVEIIAKLNAFSGGIDTAQAGLMLRQSNDSNSPFVSVAVTKADGLHFRYRTAAGAQAYEIAGLSATPIAPRWLRLVRSGSTIAGFHSTDGMSWELVGNVTFNLGADIYQGLFVSSGDGATEAQADFQEVSSMHTIPQRGENLRLWLRSDAGVVKDGSGKVSKWEDQSGNFNDAVQATAASQPSFEPSQINGKPALRFTASANSFMTVPNHESLNPDYVNIIAVIKRTAGSSGTSGVVSKYAGTSPSGYLLGYVSGTSNLRSVVRGVSVAKSQTQGEYDVVASCYNDGKMELSTDNLNGGVTAAISTPLTSGTHDLLIGRQSSGSNDFDGDIVEILVYSGELSPSQRLELRGYLYSKYNIGYPPYVPFISLPQKVIFSGNEKLKFDIPFGSRIYYKIDNGDWIEYIAGEEIAFSTSAVVEYLVERAGYTPLPQTIQIRVDAITSLVPRQGQELWLRADVGASKRGIPPFPGPIGTFPDDVIGWNDLTFNGNTFISPTPSFTVFHFPSFVDYGINGKPSVRFESGRFMQVTGPLETKVPTNISILAVVKQEGAAGRIIDKIASSAGYSLRMTNATTAGAYINAASATKTVPSANGQMLLQTFDGAKLRLYTYATGLTPTAPTETTLAGTISSTSAITYLGGTGATNNFTGHIAEIMIFDHALSASEIRDLEAYVYDRYAIGVHPKLLLTSSVKTGIYSTPQTVSLMSESGATIYYTLDGSDPLTSNERLIYTTPIYITSNNTLKAYSEKTGFQNSDLVEETITIDPNSAEITRTGLKLWLRSDTGVVKTGADVTKWLDQSGNGHHAESQGVLLPTEATATYVANGASLTSTAIRFSGHTSTDWPWLKLANAGALNSTHVSIYAVAKRDSGLTTSMSLVGKTNLSNQGFRLQMTSDTGRGFLIHNESSGSANAAFVNTSGAGEFELLGGAVNGTNRSIFVNKLTPVSKVGTTITPSSNALTIGGYGTDSAFSGDILEIFAYEGSLTNLEEEHLRAYVQTKYGIGGGGSLPAPSANLASATYPGPQNIVFTSSVPGTTIRYTTNGSAPDETSPIQPHDGIELTGGEQRVQAVAFKAGFTPSPITERWIVIDSSTDEIPRDNMWLWLNAGVGIESFSSGDNLHHGITRWRDQSGKNQDAVQTTATAMPDLVLSDTAVFNGLPFVGFNVPGQEGESIPPLPARVEGVNEKLIISDNPAYPLAGSMTIFAVAQHSPSVSASRSIFHKATANVDDAFQGANLGFTYNEGHNVFWASNYIQNDDASKDRIVRVTTPNDQQTRVIVARTDSSGGRLSVNGGTPNSETFTSGVAASSGIAAGIGGRAAANQYMMRGGVAEIITYSTALTDAQIEAVEAYLNAKYGITPTKRYTSPGFSLPSGAYSSNQMVSLTTAPGGTVYYTLDGSTPVLNSNRTAPGNAETLLYTAAIPVIGTTTVTAVAVRPGYLESPPATRAYTIDTLRNLVPSTNLSLWLRADAGVAKDGSNKVSKWFDMSGNNLVAVQDTLGNQPLAVSVDEAFGPSTATVDAIGFTGSSAQFLQIADSPALQLSSQGSVFALFDRPSGTGEAVVLEKVALPSGSPTAGYSLRHASGAGQWQVIKTTTSGQNNQVTFPMALGSFAFGGGILSTTTNQTWKNGSLQSSAAYANGIGSTNNQPLMIGRRPEGTSAFPFTGRLVELWVYQRALTDQEIKGLQAYLNLKYGYSVGVQALPPVEASHQSGFFDSRLDVTLSHTDPVATIRYTMSESGTPPAEPTASGEGGITYESSSPIVLTTTGSTVKTITIKAKAFRDGLIPGPTSSWTYTLNPELEVPKYGMVLWLRSDQGVEYDGGTNKVSKWTDLSGWGNHAIQSADNRRPFYIGAGVNGNPVIRFTSAASNGSSLTYLQVPHHASLTPTEVSIFAVVKRTSGTTAVVVVEKYTASTAGYGLTASSAVQRTFGTNNNLTTWSVPSPGTDFNLLYGIYDKSTDIKKLFVDGIERASVTYATDLAASPNPLYIGGRITSGSPSHNLTGDVAEIIVYSRPLSVTERMRTQSYLMNKYALALPTLEAPLFHPPASPSPGTAQRQVAITAQSGATIHYTLDGSTPTTSSPIYEGPIWIAYNLTIKAIAVKVGNISSPVASGTYMTGQTGPQNSPGDTTPPVIDLIKPTHAIPQ